VIPIGGSATCTITNHDQPAHLKLVQVVVNDSGGQASATDFTVSATGPSGFSGPGPSQEQDVDAGTYSLSNSALSGYSADAWVCTGDGSQNLASITLGNGESATCTITDDDQPVVYSFTGFFAPVDNPPVLNVVKGGQGIPVKFSLGGDVGLGIFAADYPKSQQITCDSSAPVDAVEETVTAGSSSLSYDASTGQYVYVWKTNKAWAQTCRQLIIRLADGTEHSALFKFK
jgi:hypothetical protein